MAVRRTEQVLARRAPVAWGMRSRLVGLLRHQRLSDGEGLLLPSCRAIHTFGMRFAIDVVFVDRSGRVVALQSQMGPGRLSPIVWGASRVLELPAGTIQRSRVQVGDELAIEPAST